MCSLICDRFHPLVRLVRQKSFWVYVDSVFSRSKKSGLLTLSSIYTRFNTLKKKEFRKTMCEKGEITQMSNFTFFHNVFYAFCILKSFNSPILVVVCSFFEFGTISKWCIREWVDLVLKD